ncbi:unnamed protein product [Durusdinium trenchii]|uniref:Uncharacterized protein n=2 Tax=Durusdinium trenchii TaxID=1381693 RepID=A0ABP0HVB8_9DINO
MAPKVCRKRAPPSHRDLDPKMRCPVTTEEETTSDSNSLGLCGPSELRALPRSRRITAEAAAEAAQSSPVPEGLAMEEALRMKLRCLDRKLGGRMLSDRKLLGRRDLAQEILSFVQAERPLMNTEVGGKMFVDSGSANVDLFFHSVPQEKPSKSIQLENLLAKAWDENPEVCLKQIYFLGASREGKQDRYAFYDAMLWLWQKDPATLLANLHHIPECNYWKALLELLARLCEGPRRSLERDVALYGHYMRHKDSNEDEKKKFTCGDAEVDGSDQGPWCPGSRLELAAEALKRYDQDPLYRVLFERTGQLFAEQLREDLRRMQKGQRISLCAKWCPLLYHSFDRRTLISESIARWLFPVHDFPDFAKLTERQYAFRARDRLRKSLSQLKEYMKCTERLMCQQRWEEIQYQKVHGSCLSINAKVFEKHDPLRFQEFVENLAQQKGKVNVGALQPHQLLMRAVASSGFERVLAQAQWQSLVAQLRAAGALSHCIAVCDVSGSMRTPAAPNVSCMDVAISLSLLLAEVADGPFARHVITFHESPQLVKLPETHDLLELYQFMKSLDWGMSTNFHKVFDLLKSRAAQAAAPEQVFVFSDMHFAQAQGGDEGETTLRRAQKEYQKLGLELPELVFWNLAARALPGGPGAPALANDAGVVLMSGFSPQMLRDLMDPDTELKAAAADAKPKEKRDPVAVLCAALRKPLLEKLRVVYDQSEVAELFLEPGHKEQFPAEPVEMSLEPPEVPSKQCVQKLPVMNSATAQLGSLLRKEVIQAFLGRGGASVKSLRAQLCQRLCPVLRAEKKLKFRFWLDVKTEGKYTASETGHVEGTLRARFPQEELEKALQLLKEPVERAIKEADARSFRADAAEGEEDDNDKKRKAMLMTSEASQKCDPSRGVKRRSA